ncbi:type II toxin-antitoxin system death-on-curing family toxin [Halorussus halobius]|uniref:type II toxin-antitoxin system death-on-curing family toxin n=1 Tax=Halorussus halobius TaxID=1710537 RepID=UPI001092F720|nr:type II toxin-antitoxin system death-on-curing family toxin [Halorussus halobius]
MAEPDDGFWYPTVTDLLDIHEDIVAEYDTSEPGVRDEDQLAFALEYVEWGHFGDVPDSVHEKGFHLLRLLAATHPFVDANKRTSLNATTVFLAANGHRFDYGDDVRLLLKLLGVREGLLDESGVVEYLAERTTAEPVEGSGDAFPETLRATARRDREEHRDVYDALADE